MKQAVNLRPILIGGVLLLSALGCSALSLGRVKGVVWVGQPIDVTVPIKLDSGDDGASLCASADIFYSDSRINSNQIRVTAEAGSLRDEMMVRIVSRLAVDEPVVTIYLKVGCGPVTSRRYVLLAEVATDGSGNFSTRSDPFASLGALGALSLGKDPASSAERKLSPLPLAERTFVKPGTDRTLASPLTDAARPARSTFDSAASIVPSVVRKPAGTPGKARLKLDSADFLVERDPVLRSTTELLTQPATVASTRADALALWKAVNATPEEILKDAQRLQSLQSDMATLRVQNQRNEAVLIDLKGRIEKAQSEKYGNWLVYGLLAAFLSSAGAAIFFWNRSRGMVAPQWWREQESGSEDQADAALFDQDRVLFPPSPGEGRGGEVDIDLSTEVPASTGSGSGGQAAPSNQYGLTALDRVDFETSLPGTGRAVKVEELFDIQQQADFFISLGQYDQAVATLRNHIEDNTETSALAYLDLLRIFHLQGREDDYERVRREFHHVFNAEVPEFADFAQQTRGLEDYSSAMSRIVALWPTEKVLDAIEESIFRKPGVGNQAFDLEAYRELLLLYAVAKEIVEGDPAVSIPDISVSGWPEGLGRFSDSNGPNDPQIFPSTAMQPLPTSQVPSDEVALLKLQVPASPNLGLDIDFSEFEETPAEIQAPLPQVSVSASKPPDSHLVDFDLFDLATRAHAATKRIK